MITQFYFNRRNIEDDRGWNKLGLLFCTGLATVLTANLHKTRNNGEVETRSVLDWRDLWKTLVSHITVHETLQNSRRTIGATEDHICRFCRDESEPTIQIFPRSALSEERPPVFQRVRFWAESGDQDLSLWQNFEWLGEKSAMKDTHASLPIK